MKIDSHQHYWKLDRGDYDWMSPEAGVLYRDYLPADLRPLLRQYGIDQTIVVQAAATIAETEFLLELAAADNSIAGVVGWLDLEADDFPAQFERLRKNAKFVGMRPMLQDLADDRWIVRPKVLEALRRIAGAEFPFDLLVHSRHLPYVLQALDAVPGLRAVIDHVAKPEIRTGKLEPWKSLMADAARHENLFCKLSGMITEADHQHWTTADLRPYVDHVMECFGIDRVMFGSDWPVCLLAGSYGQTMSILRELLAPVLNQDRERKIFGETAARFYRLPVQSH